jgi:1,4-alpha-glucan branching enzyme
MESPEIVKNDPWLAPFEGVIKDRMDRTLRKEATLSADGLVSFASGHLYFGLHREKDQWVFREWAPNATRIFLVGDFSAWEEHPEWELK